MLVSGLNPFVVQQKLDNIIFHKCIKSAAVLQAVQSDLGITLNNTTVSAWADQGPAKLNYSQGTAANQPLFVRNLLNGYPGLRFDGTNDVIVASGFQLPAPSVRTTWIWGIVKSVSDPAGGGRFVSPNISTNACLVLTGGATPNFVCSIFNSTGPSAGILSTGTWYRFEAFFSNTTRDYVKLGPTSTTGVNCGNNSTATGRSIGAQPSEPDAHNFDIAALMYCDRVPSVEDRYSLDQAVAKKYGGIVVI